MNREIKYNAWDKRNSIMLSWNDIKQIDCTNQFSLFDDPNYIFLQFTGLKDKNGEDIYEGDIAKIHTGDPFADNFNVVVVENMGAFGIYPLDGTTDIFGNKYSGKMLCFYPDYKPNSFEVIGNIYENPELIK